MWKKICPQGDASHQSVAWTPEITIELRDWSKVLQATAERYPLYPGCEQDVGWRGVSSYTRP